jgi:hypothetical protein
MSHAMRIVSIEDVEELFRSLGVASLGDGFPDDEYDSMALFACGLLRKGTAPTEVATAVAERFERDWGTEVSPHKLAELFAALSDLAS